MASTRVIKGSVVFLFKKFSTYRQIGCHYTCRAFGGGQIVEARELGKSPFSLNSTSLRGFSSEVSASEQMNIIRQLRERTSAPIKDVKSSLVNCNWDIEVAQKDLRKRGVVLASKKSSRAATEGLLALAQTKNKAVVVELNCETYFVARNDIFQHLATSLARATLTGESTTQHMQPDYSFGPEYFENLKIALDHPKICGETSVQSAITEVAAMVGENVKLRRGFALSTSSHGVVCSYLHTCPQPGLGRIAGMLTLEAENINASLDTLREVGSSIAMHIVAAKPLFLSKDLVSSEAIESERDILKSQAESTGKPQMAIQKMVEGRLRKYFEEVVLLEQKFVMNDGVNIQSLLNELSKQVGSSVKIGNFLRMEVGEGIQRSEEKASRDCKRSRLGESANVTISAVDFDSDDLSDAGMVNEKKIERAVEHCVGDQVVRFIRNYFPTQSMKRARTLNPFHRSVRLANCIFEAATYVEEIPDLLAELDRLRKTEVEERKRATRAESQLMETDRKCFAAEYRIHELENELTILKKRINVLEAKTAPANDNCTS